MRNKSVFIACLSLFVSLLYGQNPSHYTEISWRIYNSPNWTKYVDYNTDEWKNMPIDKKEALFQIPETELKSMSTEELIEATVNSFFASGVGMYPNIAQYYDQVNKFNGFRELTMRNDVCKKMIDYYTIGIFKNTLYEKTDFAFRKYIQILEHLMVHPKILALYKNGEMSQLVSTLKLKYKEKSKMSMYTEQDKVSTVYALAKVMEKNNPQTKQKIHNINKIDTFLSTGIFFSRDIYEQVLKTADLNLDQISMRKYSSVQSTSIYTPEGCELLDAVTPPDQVDSEWNDSWAQGQINTYGLNARIIESSTISYNCHGYAWMKSEDRGTYFVQHDEEQLFFNDQAYSNDGSASYITATSSTATHGCYKPYRDHSVRVIQNGYPVNNPSDYNSGRTHVSKWFWGPLVQHAPGHDPYALKNTSIISYYKLKTTHFGTLKTGGLHYPYNKVWIGAGGITHTITDNVTIPSDISLTIMPGATVEIAAGKSITVNGVLNADGVTFTRSGTSGHWNYIKFNSSGSGTISNCTIKYANQGIYSSSDNVSVEGCIIEHFTQQAIYGMNTNINIENCTIRNPDGASQGIDLAYYSSPTISGTVIDGINGIGLYLYHWGSATFSGGRIKNCTTGIYAYNTTMEIYDNYIHDNVYGIRLGYNSSNIEIHDNDFYSNGYGLHCQYGYPGEVKWNNFGYSGTWKGNTYAGILVDNLSSGNTFLSGKWNNFYDGDLYCKDIINNTGTTLNATGNYWELDWTSGPVNIGSPQGSANPNAGPGGSLGKETAKDITTNNVFPTEFNLEQNFPNPFNPSTKVPFGLPENSQVKIDVYNTLGQKVAELTNGNYTAGFHDVQFNGSNLSTGLYILRAEIISSESEKQYNFLKKMVLIK